MWLSSLSAGRPRSLRQHSASRRFHAQRSCGYVVDGPESDFSKSWTTRLVAVSSRTYGYPGAHGGAARPVTGGDTGESTRLGTRPATRPACGDVSGAGASTGPSAGLATGSLTGAGARVPPGALFRCSTIPPNDEAIGATGSNPRDRGPHRSSHSVWAAFEPQSALVRCRHARGCDRHLPCPRHAVRALARRRDGGCCTRSRASREFRDELERQ